MTLSTYSIYLIYFYDNHVQRLFRFIYLENLGKDENIKIHLKYYHTIFVEHNNKIQQFNLYNAILKMNTYHSSYNRYECLCLILLELTSFG